MINLYLDDLRDAPTGGDIEFDHVFRSAESMLTYLRENPGQHYGVISLDHDLGDWRMDGYEFIKTVVNDPEIEFTFDILQFHTANNQGLVNMYTYITNAIKHGAFPNSGFVDPIRKMSCSKEFIDSSVDARTF